MAKRHGAKYWGAHLEAWHRSELSQRQYCAAHGLSEKSFYRWRSKEKAAIAAGQSAVTLVPVTVGALKAGSLCNTVRIASPGGWHIELAGVGIAGLADLLLRLP